MCAIASNPWFDTRKLYLGQVFAMLWVLFVLACRMPQSEVEEQSYLSISADTSWVHFDSLTVLMATPEGEILDTLFRDSLRSDDQLSHLLAPNYRGGKVLLIFFGEQNGKQVFQQAREYDGRSQTVLAISDTVPLLYDSQFATRMKTIQSSGKLKVVSSVGDTTVSIHDPVILKSVLELGEGQLSFVGWDFENDGRYDDSSVSIASSRSFSSKPRFATPGKYVTRFEAHSKAGEVIRLLFQIKVNLDAPIAQAGLDTTVPTGSVFYLHGKASDGFGPIIKREWKVGEIAYRVVNTGELKQTAPANPGNLPCLFRVTDSDGLVAEDTVVVKVITL